MHHDNLVETAATIVTDEPILGAGVFEPAKAAATGIATLHATSMLGMGQTLEFDGVPQWCLLAVTPTKLYVMSVKTMGGKNLNVVAVADPELFAVIDRDHLEVSIHLRRLFPSTLLLHDLEHDRHYHLVGSDQSHVYGNASKVFDALQQQAAEHPVTDAPDEPEADPAAEH